MPPIANASAIAALDASGAGEDGLPSGLPGTLYGVYKRAGEQVAMRYWLDFGLPSIGLRPHTVFGPARDQGVTSAPTMAMLAAAAGRRYTISYGGGAQFQYAPDVARAFIAAALADIKTAAVHNLRGDLRSIPEVIDTIVGIAPEAADLIRYEGVPLSFPASVDSSGLEEAIGQLPQTPFATAVQETIVRFRSALADRRIDPAVLG
jgi:nucleoside-diphosphate-sugar epimerase